MISIHVAGALLRVFQALVEAFPTIIIGLLVAGVLRRLIGYSGTRKLFGDNSWRSIPQAWALGMLLPVCSFGVLPVLREMRRAGVSGGALLAFGLTAPLFNPISVLYGLTLADPLVIFAFSGCSLLIVTILGVVWDRWFPTSTETVDEPAPVAFGLKRMLAVATVAVREMGGVSAVYVVAGFFGIGLLSVLLPNGSLQSSAEDGDHWAPLVMSVVAIPAYATPITVMTQVASMFQHGNSVGAAFSLLVLGAGANMGIVAWVWRGYGFRSTLLWFGILLSIVLACAYGLDRPLHPAGVKSAGHTHAFDGYCAPYQPGTTYAFERTWTTIIEKTYRHEWLGIATLLAISLVGVALNRLDPSNRLEKWLETMPDQLARYDVVIPEQVLGGISLGGLVAFSIFGCYLYYPPVEEILTDLQSVNAEVVSSASTKDWDNALLWIPFYDDWTRKLQVSVVLRGGTLTDYQRMKARVLREKLELLEHEVEDREVEEAKRLAQEVQRAHRRLSVAFRKLPAHPNPITVDK